VRQEQFLDVLDEAEAHRRFDAACAHVQPQPERVPLDAALGRVLAEDVRAAFDVPGFDRSNVDGFAVRAADTFGAEELEPVRLVLDEVRIAAGGPAPEGYEVVPGHAALIATGGAVPRGADAVVMIEDTGVDGGHVLVRRACVPGGRVAWAGTDVGRGDLVLRAGAELSSRETGLLAAVGVAEVPVVRRPTVAVLSTGDEVQPPGAALAVGDVYDSNARILADAVAECGGAAVAAGIVPDDEPELTVRLRELIEASDLVLLSGGTSKGAGDLNYRVVAALAEEIAGSPGILVHGVALKPGKPICLAVVGSTPVVILPGFPTSAVFTFHEFVAPLIRRLAGRREETAATVPARAPLRIASVVGRTQYTLVDLVEGDGGLAAYPLGAGSGSVSAFSRADGFLRIPHDQEYVDEGTAVTVQLIGARSRPADLVAVGSHCVGLDRLLGLVEEQGFRTKSIQVGSQGGLRALARGEGDAAGVHLLDEESGVYNTPFLPEGVVAIGGYGRMQGVVFRRGDVRFDGATDAIDAVRRAAAGGARMVNRNAGSGTRVLIDALLRDAAVTEPQDGRHTQARSHHAVAAAVAQGRADWGVTLDVLATANGLAFLPLREESYDIVIRASRADRPAVAALRDVLQSEAGREALRQLGFTTDAL
jgi:putative molybdopterin biosynthesis protein